MTATIHLPGWYGETDKKGTFRVEIFPPQAQEGLPAYARFTFKDERYNESNVALTIEQLKAVGRIIDIAVQELDGQDYKRDEMGRENLSERISITEQI